MRFYWELIKVKILLVLGHFILYTEFLLKGFRVMFILVTGVHGLLLLSKVSSGSLSICRLGCENVPLIICGRMWLHAMLLCLKSSLGAVQADLCCL